MNTRIGSASLFAVVAVVVGVMDLSGRGLGLLQYNRETPRRWLYGRPLRWAMFNGAMLGAGFTSRIGFWLWYVVPISALLSGTPPIGAFIYGCYGLVRGWSVWLQLVGMMRQGADDDLSLRLMRLYPRVRSWTAATLFVAGVVSSIVLGL